MHTFFTAKIKTIKRKSEKVQTDDDDDDGDEDGDGDCYNLH